MFATMSDTIRLCCCVEFKSQNSSVSEFERSCLLPTVPCDPPFTRPSAFQKGVMKNKVFRIKTLALGNSKKSIH